MSNSHALPALTPSPLRAEAAASSSSRAVGGASSRRRPNQAQGQALEALGHAIEYLVDSRLAWLDEMPCAADCEAVQVLVRASREVFSVCPEVAPVGRKVKQWVAGHLFRVAA